MKTLIRNLSAFFLILAFSINLSAQEIEFDHNFTNDKTQIVIDLKAYPNGFYMISLNSMDQVIVSKKLCKGGN